MKIKSMLKINIRGYIVLILISIIISSCVKDLKKFDVDNEDPKIVLNALVNPDSLMKIHVTQTIGALEEEKMKILNNAIVEVYQNDNLIETLDEYENGFYFDPGFYAMEGEKYRVVVQVPGFETVFSDIEIQHRPVISKIDTSSIYFYDGFYYNNEFQVVVNFEDDRSGKNYYMIELRDENYFSTSFRTHDPKAELAIDYGVYQVYMDDEYGTWGSKMVFSDKLISSDNANFKFQLMLGYYYPDYETDSIETFYITLSEISEDFYYYLRSMSIYSEDEFENFFVEKVTLFSNVNNGIGMVATLASSTYILEKVKKKDPSINYDY